MFVGLFVVLILGTGAFADPTCPKVDGQDSVYFPDKDCTKFWQCSNGVAYLFDCPANLQFNSKLNVCDWPDQAGCSSDSGEDSSSSSSSSESGEDNGSSDNNDNNSGNGDDENNNGDNGEADNGNNSGNQEDGSSSSSESNESRECPAQDGETPVYIPDEDCTVFWQCSNGVPYKQNCPAGLQFNPELNVCDWPEQAGCKGGDSSSSSSSSESGEDNGSSDNNDNNSGNGDDENDNGDNSEDDNGNNSGNQEDGSSSSESNESRECPAQDGETPVYIPDEDCTIFWQCSNGVAYKQNCPAGLQFNPELNVCDWPEQAGCKGGDSSSSSSSSESGEDNGSSDNNDNNSGNGDDENDNGDNGEDDNGNSSENQEDGSSSSESNESRECPAQDGETPVYIPDEDCTIFWQCSNGVAYKQNCPAGLQFNPELNVCDWPEQAGCKGGDSSSSSSSSESGEDNGSSDNNDNNSGNGDDENDNGDNGEDDNGNNSENQEDGSSSSESNESRECPAQDGETPVYIPDEDCTIFWQCSNGVAYKQNCPAGLQFNPELNVCDWPEQAGCKGGDSSSSSSSSESGDDNDNNSGNGDDENDNGNDNGDDNGNNSGNQESDSSSSSSESNESRECPAQDGPTPVYIPDEDCTIFWQCSNGVAYKQNCPAGLNFNPQLNVCDWPDQAGCSGGDSSSNESKKNVA